MEEHNGFSQNPSVPASAALWFTIRGVALWFTVSGDVIKAGYCVKTHKERS